VLAATISQQLSSPRARRVRPGRGRCERRREGTYQGSYAYIYMAVVVSYRSASMYYVEWPDDEPAFMVDGMKAADYLGAKHASDGISLEDWEWPRLLVDLGDLVCTFIEAKKRDDEERVRRGLPVTKYAKVDALVKRYHTFKPRRGARRASRVFFAGIVSPYQPWFRGMSKKRRMQLIRML
jgi:hypothetical protein